jgi:hypothetical protein
MKVLFSFKCFRSQGAHHSLAIEVLFRMHRLARAERGPREDAVTAG